MQRQKIIQSNGFIVEFMQVDKYEYDSWGNIQLTEGLYHKSWDWLIPVVKKTRDEILNPRLHIQLNDALLELDIKKVYNIVVALIKYNSKNL